MGWIRNLKTTWNHTFVHDVDGLVKSRRWLFVGNNSSIVVSFLVSQSFYTALLLVLFRGHPDSLRNEYLGRLAILQTAAAFLQILSPLIVERMKRRKTFLMIFRWLYHLLDIVGLGVVPLLPFSIEVKATLFVTVSTMMSVCGAIYSPGLSAWHIHSYGEETRSDYITLMNIVSNISSQLLYLLSGVFLDLFAKDEREMTAILIMRGVAVLMVALEGFSFWKVEEPVYRTTDKKPTTLEILTVPLHHPRYLLVALIAGMTGFSNALSSAYYSPYLVGTAGISYTAIGVISVLSVPLSVLVTPMWNRMIQKYGWYKILGISLPLYYVVYVFNGLTTASTHSMYYIGTIYCTVVGVGMNLVNSNLPFMEAPVEGRSSCLAFFSTFGAAMGLLGSWLGKVFINNTEGVMLKIFGLSLPNVAYACFLTFFGGLVVTVLVWIAHSLEKKSRQQQAAASV